LKLDSKEQQTVREYLLGQATQEDSSRVEERLLTDGAFYEELLIAEDELIDQYLNGALPEHELERFESHFLLAPERQQQLRFARTLNKYLTAAGAISKPEERLSPEESYKERRVVTKPHERPFFSFLPFRNPVLSYSLAAAVVVLIFGISWVTVKNLRTSSSREPGNVFAVALEPGLIRDTGEIKNFSIPPNSDTIRLQLALPDNQYQSYEAVLQDADGRPVTTSQGLQRQSARGQPTITVDVTANLLPPGDYRLKLSGLTSSNGDSESVGSYSFRVLSK
jgi:hypothetical protein